MLELAEYDNTSAYFKTKNLYVHKPHHINMKAISMLDDELYGGIVLPYERAIGSKIFLEVNNMRERELVRYMEESETNLRLLDRAYGMPAFSENILPAIYFIEPTNACNLSCIMCPNAKLSNKYFMDFDLFRKIVDDIKYVAKVIKLNYLGEPLLHPKIVEMIRYCKDNTSAKISLSTNGVLLDNKDLSEKMIGAGIDEIIFSLDAATADTYRKIKGYDNFDKVIKNIENFLKINANNTRVIIKFIQMHLNKHEVEDFKEKWEKYNCELQLSWLNIWANQLSIKDLSDTLCPNIGKPRMPCADLWYKMVINAKGIVPLCCYDFIGKNILGNTDTQNIKDIWNSQKLWLYRKIHSESMYNQLALCKNCCEWSGEKDVLQYLNTKEFPLGRP